MMHHADMTLLLFAIETGVNVQTVKYFNNLVHHSSSLQEQKHFSFCLSGRMLLVGVRNTKKKEKQKKNPKAPLIHCHQNGTKETISSVKWMPLGLPSHTTESVPTLVHIKSFLSLYLQTKSKPNGTMGWKQVPRQLCFAQGLLLNMGYGPHWAHSPLWSPENCNCCYFMWDQ